MKVCVRSGKAYNQCFKLRISQHAKLVDLSRKENTEKKFYYSFSTGKKGMNLKSEEIDALVG